MAQLPTEIVLNIPVSIEAIEAIQDALACFNGPYLGEDDGQRQQSAVHRLSAVLKKLELIANYHTQSPDAIRQQLIDEMTITARLSEEFAQLVDLVAAAVQCSRQNHLSYAEFDNLADFLERHG